MTRLLILCTIVFGLSTGRAQLTNAVKFTFAGNGYSDETVVRLKGDGTPGFDPSYDAFKMFGMNANSPKVYSKTSTSLKLSINTTSLVEADSTIPLYVYTATAGSYQISSDILGAFDNSYIVEFEDYTGQTHDVTNSMNVNLSIPVAQDTANPFMLGLLKINVEETFDHSVSVNQPDCSGQQGAFEVDLSTQLTDIRVYDVNGISIDSVDGFQGIYTSPSVQSGWYFLEMGSGMITTIDSVEIIDPAPVVSMFSVVSDTVATMEDIQFTNLSLNAQTYSWTFGDGMSATGASPVHYYGTSGTYTVELHSENLNGCMDVYSIGIEVMSGETTSTNQLFGKEQVDIKWYDEKIVLTGIMETVEVEVLNTSGQVVYYGVAGGTVRELDTYTWSPGMYVVRLLSAGSAYVEKLVVQ